MKWHNANTQDELQEFYASILPRIREAARELGYGIGMHGSMRRDFDLIAVPWVDNHASADELAAAIQLAACGFNNEWYKWEAKPCGRIATSFLVCWTEYRAISSGHIDLSVMPAA